MKFAHSAFALLFCAGIGVGWSQTAAAAEIAGDYSRPNGDKVKVSINGGRLYCRIISGSQTNFEMCHGMSKAGPGVWKGGEMKHPSMPGMMTFNGTVVGSASGLSIKGCAVGDAMCDSETWTRD